MVISSAFTIHGGTLIDKNKHLSVPTGYSSFVNIEIVALVMKLSASLLMPWQKFEVLNVFIVTKPSFIMKSGYVTKKLLNVIDPKITIL